MRQWRVVREALAVDPRLSLGAGLLFAVFVVEVVSGYWFNSPALVADGWHMLSDVTAQGIGLVAAVLAVRPRSHRNTYGWVGIKVVAALINGVLLVVMACARVLPDAWNHFGQPREVTVFGVMAVATLGLCANLFVRHMLKRHRSFGDDLNIQGMALHANMDALASIGVLVSAVIVATVGWQQADALMSALIGCVMIFTGVLFGAKSAYLLAGGVPGGVDIAELKRKLLAIPGVRRVEHLHVFCIGALPVSTVHLERESGLPARTERFIRQRAEKIFHDADIHERAIQVEAKHRHCLKSAALP